MTQVKVKLGQSHQVKGVYYEKYRGVKRMPTLLFIHGLGGDLEAWKFVIRPLQKKGYSTLAIDLPGHGFSDHPKSFRQYEIQNLVGSVKAVMQEEKLKKVVLIGHCYGAVISFALAANFPESVTDLIIISPGLRTPDYLNTNWKKNIANHLINVVSFLSPPPVLPGHSLYAKGRYHRDYEWLGLVRTVIKNSPRSYLQSLKQIINLDSENKFNQIKSKTLIIAGDKDTIFPISTAKNIQSKIYNSKLKIIKGGNHVVVLNNALEIFKIIDKNQKLVGES